MIRATVMALGLALALGWLGPALDDHSAEMLQAADIEASIRAIEARARFERAAQDICGLQAAWVEVGPGVIQCFTKRGRPVGRKQRVYTEAS